MKSGDHMKIGFKGSKEEFDKVKQKLNDNDYVFELNIINDADLALNSHYKSFRG